MSTQVLLYMPSLPVKHWISREFVQNNYGDGYVQLISHDAAFSRADGMGTVSSHKGLNHFAITYNRMIKGSGQLAYNLWNFLLARLDAGNEAFYFYNPPEHEIDPTGTETVGRYLVRLADPTVMLSWEYFKYCLYSMTGIELIEDRG